MEIEGTSARRKVRFHALVTRVVTGPKHSNTFGECSIVGVEANGMAAFLQATRIQRLALIGWEIASTYPISDYHTRTLNWGVAGAFLRLERTSADPLDLSAETGMYCQRVVGRCIRCVPMWHAVSSGSRISRYIPLARLKGRRRFRSRMRP